MKRAVRLCKRTASVALCLSFAWLFALPASAAEPAAGTLWVEPNTRMEFAWIPSGCFLMGSHLMESEKPEHIVCLKGFWMGRTEVTQAQYQLVMGQNPSQFHGEGLPVDSVSWQDAKNFANELTINTGQSFRLPSEAEWEYACRARSTQWEQCGKGNQAWWVGNSQKQSHPVAQLPPNDWGLYDMSGNLMEWVADTYHRDYTDAPDDGSAWIQDARKEDRVLRGGSWFNEAQCLRPAFRVGGVSTTRRDGSVGFRLVRVAR